MKKTSPPATVSVSCVVKQRDLANPAKVRKALTKYIASRAFQKSLSDLKAFYDRPAPRALSCTGGATVTTGSGGSTVTVGVQCSF